MNTQQIAIVAVALTALIAGMVIGDGIGAASVCNDFGGIYAAGTCYVDAQGEGR